MTIELALVISIISVGFGVYSGVANIKRNKTSDDKTEASQLTTMIVKLEHISSGISDIKADIKSTNATIENIKERLVKTEGSVKSAHNRLDDLCSGKVVIYGQKEINNEP